jgi:hypothetical protein
MATVPLAFCLLVRATDGVTWLQSEPLNGSSEAFALHLLTTPTWFRALHHQPECDAADIDDGTCACVTSQFVPGSADWARLLLDVLRAVAPADADACTLELDLVNPSAPYLVLEEDACGAPVAAGVQRLYLGNSCQSAVDADVGPFAQPSVPWQVVITTEVLARVLLQPSSHWKMLVQTTEGWFTSTAAAASAVCE